MHMLFGGTASTHDNMQNWMGSGTMPPPLGASLSESLQRPAGARRKTLAWTCSGRRANPVPFQNACTEVYWAFRRFIDNIEFRDRVEQPPRAQDLVATGVCSV